MENTQPKLKTTPQDFFLWLGAIAALYVSATALLTLLFQYINYAFPDPLAGAADPYSGAMRWSIAVLIVVLPLFFYLTRKINKAMRREPAKQELGIRKWLTYLTLFVAGAVIIGDLIFLVDNFLGGELTARFALKVVAILGVVGLIFCYYFFDLRGHWKDHERTAVRLGWIVGLVIIALVASGFTIMGSPQTQREFRTDREKISDLQSIQWQLVNHWQSKAGLPENLSALEDSISGYRVPVDPQDESSYAYERTGETSFTLCATFNQPTRDLEGRGEYPGGGYYSRSLPAHDGGIENNWEHEAGETCFERTIDPELYPQRTQQ